MVEKEGADTLEGQKALLKNILESLELEKNVQIAELNAGSAIRLDKTDNIDSNRLATIKNMKLKEELANIENMISNHINKISEQIQYYEKRMQELHEDDSSNDDQLSREVEEMEETVSKLYDKVKAMRAETNANRSRALQKLFKSSLPHSSALEISEVTDQMADFLKASNFILTKIDERRTKEASRSRKKR